MSPTAHLNRKMSSTSNSNRARSKNWKPLRSPTMKMSSPLLKLKARTRAGQPTTTRHQHHSGEFYLIFSVITARSTSALCSYRNAKEIQAKDALATPMSLEPTTPMSIDKSTMDVELAQKSIIRNDRDRFFEVVEYQKDILQYLKQLEVISHSANPEDIFIKFPNNFLFAESKGKQGSRRIHEEAAWHQRQHAINPRRLVGWGQWGVSFAHGDFVSGRELHRSFLELHVGGPS